MGFTGRLRYGGGTYGVVREMLPRAEELEILRLDPIPFVNGTDDVANDCAPHGDLVPGLFTRWHRTACPNSPWKKWVSRAPGEKEVPGPKQGRFWTQDGSFGLKRRESAQKGRYRGK